MARLGQPAIPCVCVTQLSWGRLQWKDALSGCLISAESNTEVLAGKSSRWTSDLPGALCPMAVCFSVTPCEIGGSATPELSVCSTDPSVCHHGVPHTATCC